MDNTFLMSLTFDGCGTSLVVYYLCNVPRIQQFLHHVLQSPQTPSLLFSEEEQDFATLCILFLFNFLKIVFHFSSAAEASRLVEKC